MSLEQFYYFICGAVLALISVMLWVAVTMPGKNRWNKRFFIAFFAVFVLSMITIFVDLMTYTNPGMTTVSRINTYFEYLFVSMTIPMFTPYLLHTCGEDWRKSFLFRAVCVLWVIFLILLVVSQFTTFLYYITPDNKYIRNDWYLLLIAPMFAAMLLNLAGVIKRRDKLSRKYFVAFLLHLVPLLIALFVLNIVIENLLTIVLSLCISIPAMFAIILYDQMEQYLKQQREIARQRAGIMVLQMRPHFIYNAMMSIYYLCEQDPEKARQVTLDFTSYLRKNFTAIAGEDTIPFADELEHTRAYLAIEQVQFEDSLFVEYDTPHKGFRVPPLTLQPIVENAVKHGMDPEYAPLKISVRTRETDSGSEIIVEDNGPGFSLDDENPEPNTALANIRQRLKMMCGGKLTIRPREGGGTLVTVTIPRYD